MHRNKKGRPMTASGQQQTEDRRWAMSASPLKADILQCGRNWHYSITSSARDSSDCGTERPSAFAVLRLRTSSYFVGGLNRPPPLNQANFFNCTVSAEQPVPAAGGGD